MNYNTAYNILNNKLQMLLSENAMLSFPIPDMENGLKEDVYFVYNTSYQSKKERPYAIVKAAMTDGTLLVYQNCHLKDIVDTKKHPFSDKISYEPEDKSITVDDYAKMIERLKGLYSKLREFVFNDTVTDEERDVAVAYKNLLFKMTSPDLQIYYSAIGKSFSEWLNRL